MNTTTETPSSSGMSLRKAAIVAGLGLLAMAILAGLANFSVFQSLVLPSDAKATAENIIASSGLFRLGALSFVIVAILDVIVAWALYILFKPTNKSLSLLAAWLRVVYAAIFAAALANLFVALRFFTGAGYLESFEASQLHAQGMISISTFQSGWDIALAIFGLYLLILGYLVFKSGYASKWWGILLSILLVVAGLGYLVDSIGKLMLPNYNASIAQFTFIGEVLFTFWLLWKGIKGFDNRAEKKV